MIKVQTTTEAIESKGGLLLAGKIAMNAGLGAIKSTVMKKSGSSNHQPVWTYGGRKN